MPEIPRLIIPVLLGTIRAGRRSAHVARLLPGQLEDRDEVATAPIDPADLDLPRHGTLRDPKLTARVRPFIDELIWYVRALASPRGRSVESGSP